MCRRSCCGAWTATSRNCRKSRCSCTYRQTRFRMQNEAEVFTCHLSACTPCNHALKGDTSTGFVAYWPLQVYEGSKPLWTEDEECNPVNVYGRTKREAEQAIQVCHHRARQDRREMEPNGCSEAFKLPLTLVADMRTRSTGETMSSCAARLSTGGSVAHRCPGR